MVLRNKNNLLFLIFTLIIFVSVLTQIGLHNETQLILDRIKNYGLVNFSEVAKTLINLWKPIFVANYSLSTNLSPSDRIAEQLEWTKLFIQSKNAGNVSRKSILLVFSESGFWEFWHSDNKVNCPGFSIPDKKCKLTISYSFGEPNLTVTDFDALIYAQDAKAPENKTIPDSVKQIIYTQEAPSRVGFEFKRDVLLASYYRGSDFATPYSKWVPFDTEMAKHFNVEPPDYEENFSDILNGKTKFAVMFESDCDTRNNRHSYVNELKKYISVDIFGSCGTPSPCSGLGTPSGCIKKIVRKYKFYLAFEHSNCRDYITDTFFDNGLKNDVLPVVMGAHPNDYFYAAPPKSYISVEDFATPKHLADYLTSLDKNNDLYTEYFHWKGTGVFYDAWKDVFCRICGMMFYYDYIRPPSWKEGASWENVSTCLPKGQWYWGRS